MADKGLGWFEKLVEKLKALTKRLEEQGQGAIDRAKEKEQKKG